MNGIPLVYVAGPFRAPTPWEVRENVRAALAVGLALSRVGLMPIVPHATGELYYLQGDETFWLAGTRESLRRCDGAVFLPSWKKSSGSTEEFGECIQLDKPKLDLAQQEDVLGRTLDGELLHRVLGGFASELRMMQHASERRSTSEFDSTPRVPWRGSISDFVTDLLDVVPREHIADFIAELTTRLPRDEKGQPG